jgi:hypothetical protein
MEEEAVDEENVREGDSMDKLKRLATGWKMSTTRGRTKPGNENRRTK